MPAPWQYLLHHYAVFVANWALPFVVQRWDQRDLAPEQRAGAWNAASWGAAIYNFGPLSMIGWSWVTRNEWARWRARGLGYALGQSALLLLAGLRFGVVLFALLAVFDWGLAVLLGLPH